MSFKEEKKEDFIKIPEDFTILSGLLDFYSDKAGSHASFIVATIFGLFSLLSVMVTINSPLSFWLVIPYIILLLFGSYSFMNFKFYSELAQTIRTKMTTETRFRMYNNDEIETNFKNSLLKRKGFSYIFDPFFFCLLRIADG